MANENEQHLGSFTAVIINKNLRSSKETIFLSTFLFYMAEGRNTYKKLSHQAYVRNDTNIIKKKDNTIGVGDGDGGTDDEKKLHSSSYQSHQLVNEGGGYKENDENKINTGGLLDVLVGVCVYVYVYVYVYHIRAFIR